MPTKMEITREITTPLGKDKVVIKTILTGAEREQVDNAQMRYVKTSDGKNFEVSPEHMMMIGVAQKHELMKVSIVSINDDPTDTFNRWQKMYEPDYNFVYNEVVAAQKKIIAPVPTSSMS